MVQTNEEFRATMLEKTERILSEQLPFLEFKVNYQNKKQQVMATITGAPHWIRRFPALEYNNYPSLADRKANIDLLSQYDQTIQNTLIKIICNYNSVNLNIKMRLGFAYLTKKSLEDDYIMFKMGQNLNIDS